MPALSQRYGLLRQWKTHALKGLWPTARFVQGELLKRLHALNLTNFEAYVNLIRSKNSGEEKNSLISAVTTNVTSFFREFHHFEMLRDEVLPPLIARALSGGRVRIWSAGCSTGEEPYSIAAVVEKALPNAHAFDIRILATDIDCRVVSHAMRASYDAHEDNEIPYEFKRDLFSDRDGLHVKDNLRKLVRFNVLNLIDDWPMCSDFDVIFCRNVVIYFDENTQSSLWDRFGNFLNNGGRLFIGHSEKVGGPAASIFKLYGTSSYIKI